MEGLSGHALLIISFLFSRDLDIIKAMQTVFVIAFPICGCINGDVIQIVYYRLHFHLHECTMSGEFQTESPFTIPFPVL